MRPGHPRGAAPRPAAPGRERGSERRSARVVGVAALVVVAGCGGQEQERLPKADYITAVDRICADYQERLAQVAPPADLMDTEAVARFLRDRLDLAREQLQAIRDVGEPEPEAEAATIDGLLDRQDMLIERAEDAAEAFADGDPARGRMVADEVAAASGSINDGLRAFGLQVCPT